MDEILLAFPGLGFTRAVLRFGGWGNGSGAGVVARGCCYVPSDVYSSIGFRACKYYFAGTWLRDSARQCILLGTPVPVEAHKGPAKNMNRLAAASRLLPKAAANRLKFNKRGE